MGNEKSKGSKPAISSEKTRSALRESYGFDSIEVSRLHEVFNRVSKGTPTLNREEFQEALGEVGFSS
jgi:hypothetical protein